jgi:exosortase
LALSTLLALNVVVTLWGVWRSDKSFSHGPIVPIAAAGLLWARRSELNDWKSAAFPGLLLLVVAAVAHLLSIWADIVFLKPLSLIGMIAGGVWFLGGWKMFSAAIGAIGFLLFMIPWPTLLIDKLSFPMQLMSSSYAAMLGGMVGLPLHREGVNISVLIKPEPYNIIVAKECSGLTSLIVLLALGYLISYFTPAKLGWRLLLFLTVIPLALLTNAVRLTVILIFGGYVSRDMAKWVHDNEGPVLIFICSVGLMALRHILVTWLNTKPLELPEEGNTVVPIPNTSG